MLHLHLLSPGSFPWLESRFQQGEVLSLTQEVRDLLQHAVPTVVISRAEAETALFPGPHGCHMKMGSAEHEVARF